MKRVLTAVIATAVICSYTGASAGMYVEPGQVMHDECQYPARPYVNGGCDNSDPANPEIEIKGTPVKVFIPEPPEQNANKCVQYGHGKD